MGARLRRTVLGRKRLPRRRCGSSLVRIPPRNVLPAPDRRRARVPASAATGLPALRALALPVPALPVLALPVPAGLASSLARLRPRVGKGRARRSALRGGVLWTFSRAILAAAMMTTAVG